jgi:hypothetical protein
MEVPVPTKDPTRWAQNEDGTWRNIAGREEVEAEAPTDEAYEDVTEAVVESEGYEAMTKPELQAELESRGLPTSGNKPELIERLEENDV